MRFVGGVIAGTVLAACSGLASAAHVSAAQTGGASDPAATKPAEISFQFERPGLPVPRFTLRVDENGTGSYQAEEVEGPGDRGAVQYLSAKHIDRTLNLTSAALAKIFKATRELGYFNMNCETKTKNIAKTGKKTLSYAGRDGLGSCTFNYSDNKDVEMLTDTFLGIAFTLDAGRRLAFLHRYDRLGLDAEMIGLERETVEGHALELGTIAPVLSSIASDSAVMQRVRLQAAKLLKQIGSDSSGSNNI